MSVLQMQRISICALKKDRKAILEELQELGVLEIETSKVTADGLDRPDTAEEKQRSEKQALMYCRNMLRKKLRFLPPWRGRNWWQETAFWLLSKREKRFLSLPGKFFL